MGRRRRQPGLRRSMGRNGRASPSTTLAWASRNIRRNCITPYTGPKRWRIPWGFGRCIWGTCTYPWMEWRCWKGMRTASTSWGAAERLCCLRTVPSAREKPFGAFFHGRVWAAPGGAGGGGSAPFGRLGRRPRPAAQARCAHPPPPRPAGSRPGRPRIIPAPGRWSRRNGQGGSKKNSGKGAEKPQDIARNTRLRGHFKKSWENGQKRLAIRANIV